MLKHALTSAVIDDGDPTIVGPDAWNEDHVVDETPPGAPTSGLRLFANPVGNRKLLATVGPAGLDVTLQPFFGRNKIGIWMPIGNATTVPIADGIVAPTTNGTATARNVATTNFVTRLRRLGYVSAATAGSTSGFRSAAAQFTIGGGLVSPRVGGFHFVCRFVPSSAAALASGRMFIGLTSSTGVLANSEPDTFTNVIGVAKLSTSQNLHIVYGGSAAQAEIDLGVNFPADGLSTDAYELALFAPPDLNNTVYYTVTRLNTGDVASGTLTAGTPGTQLPASTTLLAIQGWRSNNATAQAVGLDLCSLYIETDN